MDRRVCDRGGQDGERYRAGAVGLGRGEGAPTRPADLSEEQPVRDDWHQKLIERLAKPLVGPHARPTILSKAIADDLDETRRFRHVAMRSYGTFDAQRSGPSIAAAKRLATTLADEIRRFRDKIDPG